MEEIAEAIDLTETARVLMWNERLLRVVGIWPLKVYDPIFILIFFYLSIHCTLAFADLSNYSSDLDSIVTNLSESICLFMTLMKITIFRINRRSMAQFLTEIKKDFRDENYKTREERLIFLYYNRLAYRFITIAVPSMAIATMIYYFKALMTNVRLGSPTAARTKYTTTFYYIYYIVFILVMNNSSSIYQLPYKTRPVMEIQDATTYAIFCTYQWLAVPTVVFGYVGSDCFFISLALHITSQFAVLAQTVERAFEDFNDRPNAIRKLILRHYRLIRLAETLENDFNIVVLQQLLGTTFHLCISGYNALISSSSISGQSVTFIIFFAYALCVLSTLFVYCYIGECLIEESTSFGEALYNYKWYNVSSLDMKLIYICMIRARKPLKLTYGKFCALSLCTFTDILKTSMGYLSVLRTFL